jgi:glycosyltransferase involved in cell wall biosynthesis
VDPEKFKPNNDCTALRQRIGTANRQIVLFVGRLIPRKGLPYLIEAAKRVVKERNETLFVIAGDGPLKNQVLSDVKQAGLGRNFVFLGDVKENELPALYSCADVFAFPSIQEGQGIVLLEAQASATPVVAFNVSGVAEAVLDKETGLLVEPEGGEFAEGILKVLSDDVLRKKLGANGRERVLKELTWDICAQKMLGVYREAAYQS